MSNSSVESSFARGLSIQTSWGRAGGVGTPRTKRSGWASKAFRNTASRSFYRFPAAPSWTSKGGHPSQAAVRVHHVVPVEEVDQETPGVLHRPEPFRKLRAVWKRLERTLRIRVVMGDVRTTVGLGHSQVGEQQSHRLRDHRRTPDGVDRPLPLLDALSLTGLLDQGMGQARRFPDRRHPSDPVAREVGPWGRTLERGGWPTVPVPDSGDGEAEGVARGPVRSPGAPDTGCGSNKRYFPSSRSVAYPCAGGKPLLVEQGQSSPEAGLGPPGAALPRRPPWAFATGRTSPVGSTRPCTPGRSLRWFSVVPRLPSTLSSVPLPFDSQDLRDFFGDPPGPPPVRRELSAEPLPARGGPPWGPADFSLGGPGLASSGLTLIPFTL